MVKLDKIYTRTGDEGKTRLATGEPVARNDPAPEYCGITCGEVQKNARAWVAEDLSPEMSERIEAHLEECPHCPRVIQQVRLEDDQSAIVDSPRILLATSN